MITIELKRANRYLYDDVVYAKGQQYTVNTELAEYLIDQEDSRGIPMFREVRDAAKATDEGTRQRVAPPTKKATVTRKTPPKSEATASVSV